MIVNETFHFHARDGSKRELLVPRLIWEEGEEFWDKFNSRYDSWLAWQLTGLGENLEHYDVRELAFQLIRELADARPDWKEKHSHLALSAELAERYKIPVGESALAYRAREAEEREWFVPGLIARGGVLLIGGREKLSGKSMLLMNLIGSMERAEPTLFGEPHKDRIRTLLLTEEPEFSIREKLELFNLRDSWIVEDHEWSLDKFAGRNSQERWETKLSILEALAKDWGAEHVIIDPLARTAQVEEEAGRELGMRMEAVGRVAYRSGLAMTVVHHANKKSDAAREDKMRGSTSLTASPDQIVYVQRHDSEAAHAKYPTQRELLSYGRLMEMNWERTIEYQDGKYVEVDVPAEVAEKKKSNAADKRAAKDLIHMTAFKKLNGGGQGVTREAFASHLEVSAQAAAKVLKHLEEAGRLTSRMEGRKRLYLEADKDA